MNIHDATEQAYKRGYEAGVKEFAQKLWINCVKTLDTDTLFWLKEIKNHTLKELTESKNDFEG